MSLEILQCIERIPPTHVFFSFSNNAKSNIVNNRRKFICPYSIVDAVGIDNSITTTDSNITLALAILSSVGAYAIDSITSTISM